MPSPATQWRPGWGAPSPARPSRPAPYQDAEQERDDHRDDEKRHGRGGHNGHRNATDATDATKAPDRRRSGPTVCSCPTTPEELLTSGEVARRLGVAPRAVGRWVARGMLTPTITTPGRRYRFRWSEVEQQLREHGGRPADEDG